MGTPPPSPSHLPETTRRRLAFLSPGTAGALLYGAAFSIFTALIFTTVIKPRDSTPLHLPLTYPKAHTVDVTDTFFGIKVVDPYRWLEDGKSPETQEWVAEQEKLSRAYLDALPGRAGIAKHLRDIYSVDSISLPDRAGDRLFYVKRKSTDAKAILYWCPFDEFPTTGHILIDPNQLNNGSLGTMVPSPDGKLLLYSLKAINADEATLYVKDVESGKDLQGEVIDGAKYARPSWLADGSGFAYTYLPPGDSTEDRSGLAEIRFHKLGTDPKNDPVLHSKTGDPNQFMDALFSRDGKWIFYEQGNEVKNDIYYQSVKGIPTARMADNWESFVTGKNFLYTLVPWNGEAYIVTNEDAPHYRLFKVNIDDPRRSRWREIVPESPIRTLNGVSVVGGRLVLNEMEKLTSRIEIHDLDGKLLRDLELPNLGGAIAEGEPDHDELFYSFESFTEPNEIFKTNVNNPSLTPWAKIEIPVDPSPYIVEQKLFPSKDHTLVPMFIIHRKDILLDGSTPFLLTGYGGFGTSQTPSFRPSFYPWLEAGGGFAVVNLRGGAEFDDQWHKAGMLLQKQNAFDDCIAAAQYLITQGYTKPDRLAVRGGPKDGLLAGAVMTQRPDLFRAVICEAPLLDMLRLDQAKSGKPLTTEYGSTKDLDQFTALKTYSPYHHVAHGTAYPSVLIFSAADNDRVNPMHARKMTAALQSATASSHPILLRSEAENGSSGGDPMQRGVDYNTDLWSFLIHETGAKPPEDPPDQISSH